MLSKALPATPPKTVRFLLAGALLCAAQVSLAQNSFNRWEGATPTPTPGKTAVKRGSVALKEKAWEEEKTKALAERHAKDSLQLASGQSVTLRRGLGQRLRQNSYSKEDAGFYDFTWEHLQYPPTALRAGLTGQVMVRLEVNPDGGVTNSTVTGDDIHQSAKSEKGASTAAGREAMRHNAQQLLLGLRFEPAPSTTQEEVPIRYVMQ
ncbi:energy transducer TonB [Hymenobacter sp. GOD-10R]|uniref:energy transducer TonB n=1 Tax=Hymenobacter sp. GOD-10R TaxID=3093922 RepID=UPI002D79A027|nr:energy transducer TonB [Hymenobacter sp. GOD-10R]WRQ31008.1 energy transducer TonB [Hymenobacter sp. GOD-10R]